MLILQSELKSFSYLGQNIWEILALELKQSKSLSEFKAKIEK